MADKKPDQTEPAERTATDDMADRYRHGAHIVPATGDPNRSEPDGLPPGMHDSTKSPVAPK